MSCHCWPNRVSAPTGSASATENGSQSANWKRRPEESDSRGKCGVKLGDLRPGIVAGTNGKLEDNLDSLCNRFASSFMIATN